MQVAFSQRVTFILKSSPPQHRNFRGIIIHLKTDQGRNPVLHGGAKFEYSGLKACRWLIAWFRLDWHCLTSGYLIKFLQWRHHFIAPSLVPPIFMEWRLTSNCFMGNAAKNETTKNSLCSRSCDLGACWKGACIGPYTWSAALWCSLRLCPRLWFLFQGLWFFRLADP